MTDPWQQVTSVGDSTIRQRSASPEIRGSLARISHQPPAASADRSASQGRAPSGLLDILLSMPASASVRAALIYGPIRALATESGEKCGLVAHEFGVDSIRPAHGGVVGGAQLELLARGQQIVVGDLGVEAQLSPSLGGACPLLPRRPGLRRLRGLPFRFAGTSSELIRNEVGQWLWSRFSALSCLATWRLCARFILRSPSRGTNTKLHRAARSLPFPGPSIQEPLVDELEIEFPASRLPPYCRGDDAKGLLTAIDGNLAASLDLVERLR
jgi:hypothetical protein